MVQRSDFSWAKIQGALGLALGPCVLFSVLAGRLVSGLAMAGVVLNLLKIHHRWPRVTENRLYSAFHTK